MHEGVCTTCEPAGKPVQYTCDCEDCSTIEFDEVPSAVPYCCGSPMKRVK